MSDIVKIDSIESRAVTRKIVNLGLLTGVNVEDNPRALARSGAGAEFSVNSRVVIDAILDSVGSDLNIPITSGYTVFLDDTGRLPDINGAKSNICYIDNWAGKKRYLSNSQELLDFVNFAKTLPTLQEGKYTGLGLVVDKSFARNALATDVLTGPNSNGVIKSIIRELGRYGNYQGHELQDWLSRRRISVVK